MLIIGWTVLGILLFLVLEVVTILFGAAANKSAKEALLRTERERGAGLTGDFTSDTPSPIHDRYANT